MTIGLADLTAAPQEFDVNGRKLTLRPLRFLDWSEIDRQIGDDIVERAKEMIKDKSLNDTQRRSIMAAAFEEADKIDSIDSVARGGKSHLTTFKGMLNVVQQSTGKQMSLDELDSLFAGDLMLLIKAYTKVREISFPKMFIREEQTANPPMAAQQAPQNQ